ncbi:MAG: MATE family efflux transporter [Bacteroidales bacterium]|nr:MATE family efflux transporter [Bacteroidales bacterium]
MNRKILNLAVPNIVTNITVPLLGLVDLSLMGHLDSKLYIGAISLGGMIFNFIYMSFSFLRMGTSGFTAQAYGTRDLKEMSMILSRALLIALLISLTLIILQKPIVQFAFFIVKGSQDVEQLARSYFYIRIWAAPATMGLYVLTGWYIGMQNARIPMFIAITVNSLNIGFNVFLVYVMNMKSDGVALGTVMAQYSGLLLGLFFFQKHYGKLFKHWKREALLKFSDYKKFFMVNKDIFIRTICLIFTLSFFTTQSANTNDTILAVNTLLFQFFLIFSFFIDGFAYAAEALVGRFIGAKEKGNLKSVIRLLFFWGVGLSIPFSLVYVFGGKYLLYFLTDNETVISQSMPYMFWVKILPLITFAAFLWDGIYVGATSSVAMRNTMLIATLLIFLPSYYLLRGPMGNHGLWLALILFMITRSLVLTLLAKKAVLTRAFE